MTVEHKDGYAVSTQHADGGQAARQGVGTLLKLFPGIACVAADNGLVAACYLFCMRESFSNVHGALLPKIRLLPE